MSNIKINLLIMNKYKEFKFFKNYNENHIFFAYI